MLKTIKISVVAVLALFAFSQPTMAEDSDAQGREFAEIYTDCGLGAMIAPRTPAVAAVTNVTWDLGTTAVSSEVSSPATCAGGKERTAAFIHDTYDSLEKDLASGNGTYLDTLLVTAGCETQVHQELTNALRTDFTGFVAAPGYSDLNRYDQAKGLHDMLYKQISDNYSESCG